MKIGIIGGSFNPIHNAHLIMANIFASQLTLNKLFFVPANVSPFKADKIDDFTDNAQHRLNMLKLAVQDNSLFHVSEFEINNKSISYTYITMQHFRSLFPKDSLFMLIGLDQALSFHKWTKYKAILDNCQLCVANRIDDTHKHSDIEKQLPHLFTNSYQPILLDMPLIEISSTLIRTNISKSISCRYLLPDKVIDYIKHNQLYK